MQQDTFISHLVELRERLLRAILAVALAMVALLIWPGAGAVYDLLALPLIQALPVGSKMIATGVITPFVIPLKVTVLAAFLVALPYVLYEVWAFVAPGLYEHEKKLGLPLVVASTLLFFLGIAFCYFFVFGRVFSFILEWAPKSITVAPDIENYLNFVITMFIAFGVAFEIPVAVILLVRSGIVSVEKLAEARSYVILGSAFVAAIVTPPDAISMLALFIPMCILFEAGLVAARFAGGRQKDVESRPSSIDPSGNTP
ncbi:MAG: twin-arginine translocase subunit TatC [Pseudomonadota bacterium]